MPFEVHPSDLGEVRVFDLSGQLDSRAAPAFERELIGALSGGRRFLLLDLRELEFISSAGLRVLLMTGKRLAADGGCLALCALNAGVRQVFDIAGFAQQFTIERTREEALAWLVEHGKTAQAAHMARSLLRPEEPRPAGRSIGRPGAGERSELAAELLKPRSRPPAGGPAAGKRGETEAPAKPRGAKPKV